MTDLARRGLARAIAEPAPSLLAIVLDWFAASPARSFAAGIVIGAALFAAVIHGPAAFDAWAERIAQAEEIKYGGPH